MKDHQQMLSAKMLLFVVICSLSTVDQAATTAATTSSPSPQIDDAIFESVSRTISSITIRWNSTTFPNDTEVYAEAYNAATLMTVLGPKVSATAVNEFTIPDLAVDTEYRVCLHVSGGDAPPSCDVIRTIPTVRFDTVLAVLVILAFIVLLVLTAFICWRCAMRHSAEECDCDDEANNDVENNGKPAGDDPLQISDEKSPLLHAPGGGKSTKPDALNSEQPPSTLYLFLASPPTDNH